MPQASCFWICLLTLLASVGWAAERAATRPERPDPTQISLEELLNTEVISVTKRLEKRAEVAAAVHVITQEDIRRAGVTSLPDALRLAPGVEVARIDANKWAVGIRGFASRLSRSILVLIDGRSVYSPLFAGVYWEVQDTLLEDVDRIEVIRGPGGTVWGANAVNGVINIITKKARETQGGLLMGGAGSEEQGFGGVRYGGQIGQEVFYRVYGKGFQRDAAFHSTVPDFDDWRMGQAGFRADWEGPRSDSVTVQGDVYIGESGQRTALTTLVPPATTAVQQDADLAGGNLLGRWQHVFSPTSDLGFEFQPSARLLWTPAPRHAVWAAVTRAVRTPSRVEHDLTLTGLLEPRTPTFTRVSGSDAFVAEKLLCTGAYAQRNITQRPKVILLDLKLPLVSGIEVLRQVKAGPRTSMIPVVALTSSREDRDIDETYRLGVNSYITKPVDFEQFTEAVRTLGMYWVLLNQPPVLPG